MKTKKTISWILVAAQISLGLTQAVMADTAAPQTPEFNLLSRVIALQGEKLSQDEAQKQLSTALSDYTTSAATEGQALRLQQATVDLGLLSQEQAVLFTAQADAAAAQMAAKNPSGYDEINAALSGEITALSNLHSQGAQFSACEGVGITAGVLLTAGVVSLVAGRNSQTMGNVGADLFGIGFAAGIVAYVLQEANGGC